MAALAAGLLAQLIDGIVSDVEADLMSSGGGIVAPSQAKSVAVDALIIESLTRFSNHIGQETQMLLAAEVLRDNAIRARIPTERLYQSIDHTAVETAGVNEADAVVYRWQMVANPGGVKICPMCLSLNGQEYRQDQWVDQLGYVPGNGYTFCLDACRCQLVPVFVAISRQEANKRVLAARRDVNKAGETVTGLQIAIPPNLQSIQRRELFEQQKIMSDFHRSQKDRSPAAQEAYREKMRFFDTFNNYLKNAA